MLASLKHQHLAIGWAIIVVILCDIPTSGLGGSGLFFEGFDKLAHTGFFFVLTVLLFYGKIREQKSYSYRIVTIVKIFMITALIGAMIELLQWKVFTYRSAEWWDFFCDMLGVSMGVFGYVLLHRTRLNGKFV